MTSSSLEAPDRVTGSINQVPPLLAYWLHRLAVLQEKSVILDHSRHVLCQRIEHLGLVEPGCGGSPIHHDREDTPTSRVGAEVAAQGAYGVGLVERSGLEHDVVLEQLGAATNKT